MSRIDQPPDWNRRLPDRPPALTLEMLIPGLQGQSGASWGRPPAGAGHTLAMNERAGTTAPLSPAGRRR